MIEIRGLTRSYGDLVALRELTLTLDAGETFGFIGPNGAGKTTTMRILATLLEPSGGVARIAGRDVVRDYREVRRLIGYMPDYFGIYDDLKVWEYLDFFAAAYRIPTARRKQLVEEVLALTDLTEKADAMVDELSRGMSQRLCLAKTLIHDPAVLILDEPASGLDPRARIEMRELVKELHRMGKTILLSSHILPELADMCTKIGIIERGEMVAFGSVEELARRVRRVGRVRMRLASPAPGAEEAAERVRRIEGVTAVTVAGDTLFADLLAGTDVSAVMLGVLSAGVKLTAFEEQAADLEDAFLAITGGIGVEP